MGARVVAVTPALVALGLTALAGGATVLGGLLAVHRRVRDDRGLAVALGFAAGAMVLVSLAAMVPAGVAGVGWAATLVLVLLGAGLTAALQRLPHHHGSGPQVRLRRTGLVVAVAVGLHNLPEGLATYVAALEDPHAGAVLALAIAIHNVPEGIAVAAPVLGASGDARRAVGAAALSGLAEPVGAVLGYLVLAAVLPPAAYAAVFGLVAGVMLRVGVAELLPTARRLATLGTAAMAGSTGAIVMAAGLALLGVAG
ncbi:ZIP family metal transporter [uncultured Nocardioides sp.]|uniref:ZIP family metal transporter n=1 Tax=uncultured Nocardioides sp. TaxID=198441 RepID=UPI0026151BE5|nr:ZIP family metal transporter [uncultured Nocardioides sp.]